LIERIARAFAGVPRPKITRSVARGYDDEWHLSPERVLELQALDSEVRWQDVTEEGVRFSQEYFVFANAEGWRFYLPAHMTFYLRGFPDFGWDAVYLALTGSGQKLDLLDDEQRACVHEFLEIIHDHENGKLA
jgi:hypothetical protein